MNLWLRLIWYVITARWRPEISLPEGRSILRFRVWPHDLDTSLHLNNGRYLTLMDQGRLDLMVKGGLWRAVLRHRWTPVATAVKIRFRREIRLFEPFRIETRILAWDATHVIIEQVFLFEQGRRKDAIAAHALFKGGLYDRTDKAFVPVERLMREAGVIASSPAPSAEVEAFLKADEELKRAAQRRL